MAALEADPTAVSEPVAFIDIQPEQVVKACTDALNVGSNLKPRFLLQRARGRLRGGQAELALSDLNASHKLEYPAATFGLATAYFLGDDVERDDARAESLFLNAYEGGVYWAARGLASLYGDPASELFDLDKSEMWEDRFHRGQQVSKIISSYRMQCAATQDEFIELVPDDYTAPSKVLQIDQESIYELRISEDQIATVVYADFSCENIGRGWCGSGGCSYHIVAGGQVFSGAGGKPYSFNEETNPMLILSRGGGACTLSDGRTAPNTSPCFSVATWDTANQLFSSVDSALPLSLEFMDGAGVPQK